MKKALKYIIIFLWAGFFLTGGIGFNIEKYCCNFCASKGPENIAAQLCQIAKLPASTNCLVNQQEEPCCSLKRYQVDIPVLYDLSQISQFQELSPIQLFFSTSFYSDKFVLNQVPLHPPPNITLLNSGRKILAFKSVLLI